MAPTPLCGVFVRRFHVGCPAISGPISCSIRLSMRSLVHIFMKACVEWKLQLINHRHQMLPGSCQHSWLKNSPLFGVGWKTYFNVMIQRHFVLWPNVGSQVASFQVGPTLARRLSNSTTGQNDAGWTTNANVGPATVCYLGNHYYVLTVHPRFPQRIFASVSRPLQCSDRLVGSENAMGSPRMLPSEASVSWRARC